jgi:hypothetical protein
MSEEISFQKLMQGVSIETKRKPSRENIMLAFRKKQIVHVGEETTTAFDAFQKYVVPFFNTTSRTEMIKAIIALSANGLKLMQAETQAQTKRK